MTALTASKASTHIMDQCFPYEHPKDVCEGDRLPWALLVPQSLDVALDLLRGKQQQWVVAHRVHQLLIDLLGALGWEVRVGIQSWHVPAMANRPWEHQTCCSVSCLEATKSSEMSWCSYWLNQVNWLSIYTGNCQFFFLKAQKADQFVLNTSIGSDTQHAFSIMCMK